MPPRKQTHTSTSTNRVLILDNGAHTIKAGFSTSSPSECITIPNCIARTREKKVLVGKQLETCKDYGGISFRQPVEKGHLVNWEVEKEIWDRTFVDEGSILHCEPKSTTLILTEAPNVTAALQSNCDQMIFEEYEFNAYYRCIGPTLIAWNDTPSLFRSSDAPAKPHHPPAECLLVIDLGYSATHITPILHGSIYHPAVRRLDVGGKVMTNYLKELFSIRQYNMMEETYIVNEIKEATCFISTDFRGDLDKVRRVQGGSAARGTGDGDGGLVLEYVLPDYTDLYKGIVRPYVAPVKGKTGKVPASGQEQLLTVGNERFLVPELLFNPGDVGYSHAGLPETILQSVELVPDIYRATLLSNIILIGGSANLPGLKERLETELRQLAPEYIPIRIAVGDNDGQGPHKYVWQGGRELAGSRSALEGRVVTKAEYEEFGHAWVTRKFNTSVVSASGGGGTGRKRGRHDGD